MDISASIACGLLVVAVSGGMVWYFSWRRTVFTEMLGMMVGMTMGMMTGILVGCVIGAATDMFVSDIVGVLAGLAFGILSGRWSGWMGIMDGAMAGVMGGMMGAMLGVMLQYDRSAVAITTVFMFALYLAALAGLVRLVEDNRLRETATDPVCGMKVDVRQAITSPYHGHIYYFCAPACKRAFDEHPEKYNEGSLTHRARS